MFVFTGLNQSWGWQGAGARVSLGSRGLGRLKLVIAYKNFAAHKGICHIGLGVAGMNIAKSLHQAGIRAAVWPIVSAAELEQRLAQDAAVTHVVVSAPWIPTDDLVRITRRFEALKFAVNSHSNVGFLQADSNGVKLIREAMELERAAHNFHLGGNSTKFCRWVTKSYGVPCTYLPNLYYLDEHAGPKRPLYRGGTLRIGAFGATRPQKNFMSAAGAALQISREMKADTELWLSAGRTEGGGDTILRAAREMLRELPQIRIVENQWQPWPKFREVVGHMHLLLQPSYTESFNMVTADGVAMGISSVVSDAIEWPPESWKAHADDVTDIAGHGLKLLRSPRAARRGLRALQGHNRRGLDAWKKFLSEP